MTDVTDRMRCAAAYGASGIALIRLRLLAAAVADV
jgi:hypothetical protein